MANIIEFNIKQLNAELARFTKPKAYVQFYCDPYAFTLTAYDTDVTDIDADGHEIVAIERDLPRGSTEEEYWAACDEALKEMPLLLVRHGWSPEFHRLETI